MIFLIEIFFLNYSLEFSWIVFFFNSNDDQVYALKQIEGSGISMSACREIAVSFKIIQNELIAKIMILFDFLFIASSRIETC